MPAYRHPNKYPGINAPPAPIRGLVELLFPPEQVLPIAAPMLSKPAMLVNRMLRPNARIGEIYADPYGISPKPTRRQFLDRALGNPIKRARSEENRAFEETRKDWNDLTKERFLTAGPEDTFDLLMDTNMNADAYKRLITGRSSK